PSRNAVLLSGSSQESVPGTNVWYSALAYSSARTVSVLAMTTRSFSSTSLAPCDQTSQCVHTLASPTALPSAKPGGVPFSFSARQSLRNPALSLGKALNPAALTWLSR